MADKVARDYSDPQIKEWWEGVDRAAAEVPKLTVAKPISKCAAFVASKTPRREVRPKQRDSDAAE